MFLKHNMSIIITRGIRMKKAYILLLLPLLLVGCKGNGDPEPNPPITPTPNLTSLTVTPTVLEYDLGSAIDKSTLTVVANYDDNSHTTLAADKYTLTYDFSQVGTAIPVTATYNSINASYNVLIYDSSKMIDANSYSIQMSRDYLAFTGNYSIDITDPTITIGGSHSYRAEIDHGKVHMIGNNYDSYVKFEDMGDGNIKVTSYDSYGNPSYTIRPKVSFYATTNFNHFDFMFDLPYGDIVFDKTINKYTVTNLMVGTENIISATLSYKNNYPEDFVFNVENKGEVTLSYSAIGTTSVTLPTPTATTTVTINFTGNTALQTGDSTADNFKEKMLTFLNSQADIFEDISFGGFVQFNAVSWNADEKNYLILGKQSGCGSICFTFKKNVKTISFDCQNYHTNWSPYGEYDKNIDSGVMVYIDDNSYAWRLSEDDDYQTVGEIIHIVHTYSGTSTTSTVYNLEGYKRVFIHSMSVTYITE